MSEQQTTPEPEETMTAGRDATSGSTGRVGRTEVAAVFSAVLDAVAGIARDVADTAGPAIHDALVKAGPGVREGAARAADVTARAADAAGPVATKVAGATGDVGHKLARRSRGLATDLRSMSAPTNGETGPDGPTANAEAAPGAGETPTEEAATGEDADASA